jgi:hypothetical protein
MESDAWPHRTNFLFPYGGTGTEDHRAESEQDRSKVENGGDPIC